MEEQVQVFFFPSRDVQELLRSYNTSVYELLEREGLNVRRGYAPDPVADQTAPEREPVSVILLASAALAAVLAPTIGRIISELARKEAFVTEKVCIPVEDSRGNIVRDAEGQPLVQQVDRYRWVESSQLKENPSDVKVKGHGLEVRLRQGDSALVEETPPATNEVPSTVSER